MILTVTLPVYNAMPYLPASVESVLAQSYGGFEFLIIDDGSSDGSIDYLRSLRDARIKLLVRENTGLGATLNELFGRSRTEYVARMDADDVCQPDRLEKQMAFLREHPDVLMLGTGIDFLVGTRIVNGFRPAIDHATIRRRLLQKRPGVNHPTIVVRRDAWAAVGGYRVARAGEDLDFCLRLCDFGKAANIPEALYRYRLRKQSLSFTNSAEINRGYAFATACAKARECGLPEPDMERFCAAWQQRPPQAKIAEKMATASQYLYRLSIINYAEGQSLLSLACLAGAAICQPQVALSRIRAATVFR